MTGYLETAEIIGNYSGALTEIIADLSGLSISLQALALVSSNGVCIPPDAIELAAQQALMMSSALDTIADYVKEIEKETEQ